MASMSMSAAWAGEIVGNRSYILVGAIIGVRTSGMWMLVNVIRSWASSLAATLDQESSAAFEAVYALKRGVLVSTAIELTFTMWPERRSDIPGRTPMIRRTAPK